MCPTPSLKHQARSHRILCRPRNCVASPTVLSAGSYPTLADKLPLEEGERVPSRLPATADIAGEDYGPDAGRHAVKPDLAPREHKRAHLSSVSAIDPARAGRSAAWRLWRDDKPVDGITRGGARPAGRPSAPPRRSRCRTALRPLWSGARSAACVAARRGRRALRFAPRSSRAGTG